MSFEYPVSMLKYGDKNIAWRIIDKTANNVRFFSGNRKERELTFNHFFTGPAFLHLPVDIFLHDLFDLLNKPKADDCRILPCLPGKLLREIGDDILIELEGDTSYLPESIFQLFFQCGPYATHPSEYNLALRYRV
jgi:hypothetical protein